MTVCARAWITSVTCRWGRRRSCRGRGFGSGFVVLVWNTEHECDVRSLSFPTSKRHRRLHWVRKLCRASSCLSSSSRRTVPGRRLCWGSWVSNGKLSNSLSLLSFSCTWCGRCSGSGCTKRSPMKGRYSSMMFSKRTCVFMTNFLLD